MEEHMLYLLATGLVVCGFMLGWHSKPVVAEFILSMSCHCGSGDRWEDCCHDKDVAEHEGR